MSCISPLKAYKILDEYKFLYPNCSSINCISFSGSWYDDSGRRFNPTPVTVEQIQIPCRKCIACRLDYAKQWALKGMLELQSFDGVGCFITLTYDNDSLPSYDLADCAKDFQDFMKRLRKKFNGRKTVLNPITNTLENPIRYLRCGEYGSQNGRPHHHAILFNFDFPDKKLKTIRNGYNVYYSKELLKLWSRKVCVGFEEVEYNYFNKKKGKVEKRKYKRKIWKYKPIGKVEIGTVTFKSISYVARYITKKVYGDEADSHYGDNMPEFITMSRMPSIGRYWFDKYYMDMYRKDSYLYDGHRYKPPKTFDNIFKDMYPEAFEEIKAHRKEMALAFQKDTLEQFRESQARGLLAKRAINKLPRPLGDTKFFIDERKMIENDSCFYL